MSGVAGTRGGPESGGSSSGPVAIADHPRSLLVIAYFFPPLGGVGVQRTLKFVRHLQTSGWRSRVLAPADPAYPIRDPDLLADVPADIEVILARCPEPAGFVRWVAARRRGRPRAVATTADDVAATACPAGPGTRLGRTGAAWWTRLVRVFLFPDDQVLWWPFAVRAARRAYRQRPFEAIYSSSPPVTSHLIARSIQRATGSPWVADFRDPWVGNAFAAPLAPWKRRLQGWLERRIVEDADRVIVVSPSMQRAFQDRYPRAGARIVTIPNGYDRADLATVVPFPREPGRFTIVYAGSIYGDRELGLFLDGVELLVARRPEVRARLRVEFVGRVNVANQAVAAPYRSADRLGEVVSWTGFLRRHEALARMCSADALLQIIAADPGKEAVIGAKTLEYLAFDLPILAVVPPGDARAVLEEVGGAIVVDPDPESVASGLEALVEAPRPARRTDPEGRYDRVFQAKRLAAILDELTIPGPGAAGRRGRS